MPERVKPSGREADIWFHPSVLSEENGARAKQPDFRVERGIRRLIMGIKLNNRVAYALHDVLY